MTYTTKIFGFPKKKKKKKKMDKKWIKNVWIFFSFPEVGQVGSSKPTLNFAESFGSVVQTKEERP